MRRARRARRRAPGSWATSCGRRRPSTAGHAPASARSRRAPATQARARAVGARAHRRTRPLGTPRAAHVQPAGGARACRAARVQSAGGA
eukprot:5769982-Prymnesium_polylepis.1